MSITEIDYQQLNKKIFDYFNKYNNTLTDTYNKQKKTLKSLVEQPSKKVKTKKTDKITIITGDSKKITGIVEFHINNNSKALTLFVTSGKQVYREDLYLPIYISLNVTIDKINDKIQTINNDILEYLEYGDSSQSKISIQQYKLYKQLLEIVEKIKTNHLQDILIKKSTLFQSENNLLKQQKELYKQDITQNMPILATYFLNYFKLEQPLLNTANPILEGTKVYYGDEIVQIEKINNSNRQYRLVDGRMINFAEINAIPAVRNLIYNYKEETDTISIDNIINAINANTELLELFLQTININIDTIQQQRPYILWQYISTVEKETIFKHNKKIILLDDLNFVPAISSDLLYSEQKPILIGTSKFFDFEYKDIGDKCRHNLSLKNIDYSFKVDDFTFSSPLHYHKAAQYYNRHDLIEPLRAEYNDFFIHFTQEYDGLDSLFNIPIKDLNNLSNITSLKKYYLWDKPIEKGKSSISSLYFRKGLYHYIFQNQELIQCLLSTENCVLYEKVKKNTYRVNYELMEVRYFIQTGQVPFYANYNYDNKLKDFYNTKLQITIDATNKNLMEVIIETDAYNQRSLLIDTSNPIEPILIAFSGKDPTRMPDIEMIYNTLFSYRGDYYYHLVISNKGQSFEKLLLTNPELKDNIQLVSFIYVLANYLEAMNEENMKKQMFQNEQQIKKLQLQLLENQKREIDQFRLLAKSQKYIPDIIVFGLKNSLYQSIAKNVIRQNKYPMNFNNMLDSRSKLSSETEILTFESQKIAVYSQLEEQLLTNLVELYRVNHQDEQEMDIRNLIQSNDQLQLELLSRYLSANITIISNRGTQVVNYDDMIRKYTTIISGAIDYAEPNINIVLGKLIHDEDIFYVDLIPDFSQKDAIIDYLYDAKSNVILKEMDDETQEYIGIWDPIDIKIKYNLPLPEMDMEELDMEVLRFILLGTKLYYGQTEII